MPYIPQEKRPEIDEIVEQMKFIQPKGDLNYLLFAYTLRNINPSYNNYKELIGELHCAITEIERRLLAPHEDRAIERNGDVKESIEC